MTIGTHAANDGVHDFKAYASLYDKTFDEIRVKGEMVPREGGQFYDTRTTNEETYKEGEMTQTLQLPQRNEDTDRIPLLSPSEGFNKTATNIQRRSGYVITRRAITAQRTNKIMAMMTGLPKSAQRVEELQMASLFNNGFGTATTGDAASIFSTAHLQEGGEFANYSTLAAATGGFATDTFYDGWVNMQTRKNNKGFVEPMTPGEIVHAVNITEDVMKVVGSDQYPQNALNAKLPTLFKTPTPVGLHWLTSTTFWAIHANVPKNEEGFIFVWEARPSYAPSDTMNPEIVQGRRLHMSSSVMAIHARPWYAGNT